MDSVSCQFECNRLPFSNVIFKCVSGQARTKIEVKNPGHDSCKVMQLSLAEEMAKYPRRTANQFQILTTSGDLKKAVDSKTNSLTRL